MRRISLRLTYPPTPDLKPPSKEQEGTTIGRVFYVMYKWQKTPSEPVLACLVSEWKNLGPNHYCLRFSL